MPNPLNPESQSRFDGLLLVLALVLIAAPWLLGYSRDYDATATSFVSGLAIFACVVSSFSDFTRGFREVDIGLGVLTAAAPLLLHFGADRRAVMVHLLIGGAVALISAGELLIPGHKHSPAHAFWHFWDDKQ